MTSRQKIIGRKETIRGDGLSKIARQLRNRVPSIAGYRRKGSTDTSSNRLEAAFRELDRQLDPEQPGSCKRGRP